MHKAALFWVLKCIWDISQRIMEELTMSRANPRFRRNNPPLPTLAAGQNVVQISMGGMMDNETWNVNIGWLFDGAIGANFESDVATTFETLVFAQWVAT